MVSLSDNYISSDSFFLDTNIISQLLATGPERSEPALHQKFCYQRPNIQFLSLRQLRCARSPHPQLSKHLYLRVSLPFPQSPSIDPANSPHSAGLYSFFNNYDTTCSNAPSSGGTENCQSEIFSIEGSSTNNIWVYSLSTIGSQSMVVQDGTSLASWSNNVNVYPDTISYFTFRVG